MSFREFYAKVSEVLSRNPGDPVTIGLNRGFGRIMDDPRSETPKGTYDLLLDKADQIIAIAERLVEIAEALQAEFPDIDDDDTRTAEFHRDGENLTVNLFNGDELVGTVNAEVVAQGGATDSEIAIAVAGMVGINPENVFSSDEAGVLDVGEAFSGGDTFPLSGVAAE